MTTHSKKNALTRENLLALLTDGSVWPRMHRVSSRATSTSTSLSPPRVCSRCRRRGELRRVTPIRGASYRKRPGRRSSGRCDLKVGRPPDRVSCMQLVTSRTRLVHRFAAASSMHSERLPQQSGVSGRTASAPPAERPSCRVVREWTTSARGWRSRSITRFVGKPIRLRTGSVRHDPKVRMCCSTRRSRGFVLSRERARHGVCLVGPWRPHS